MTAWKKRFRLIYSAFDVPYSLHNFPIHPIFPINLRDAAWKKFHVTLIFDKYIYIFFFFQIYTNCTRVMFTTFFYRINHQYVSVYAQKYQLQSIFYRFQPWRVFLFFFLIYPIIHFPSYDRAIYWKIFEEHSGTPIYRQNKVIERENRAQQIYSMRNICVRMCMCLYIYIESDRDSEATYHRVGKLIMEAHLSIHYGVIRLISRRNTRTEYVFFSIRFSNSFRDSFCFRFSVSSLDLSFLPDRVCFFSRSRFHG